MKTRTMNIHPDVIRAEGHAWGDSPPELIFEAYENGDVTHRVRVALNPVLIEEIALKLWATRAKYQEALNSMTRVMKGESN
jgi:hypothetical protein